MDGASELGAADGIPSTTGQNSLLRVDIGEAFGSDFVPMANDIVRMVCIQVSIQVMLVLAGASGVRFLSADFLLLVFYIALGVMLYWLAVRKLVVFI